MLISLCIAKTGLSDMIKSISHFHDHVGFENRIQNPKFELYGELLVKTSSKDDIAKVKQNIFI